LGELGQNAAVFALSAPDKQHSSFAVQKTDHLLFYLLLHFAVQID